MTAKKRKPLDDALAHEFVYGSQSQETANSDTQSETQPTLEQEPVPQSTLPISPISTPQPAKFNLMSELQQPSKEPTIRLTVDLPESMHRKLSVLAAKTSRKKVEIVRLLLDEALKDVEE
ncbi:CopG family transcriptional regulator [Nostoc cf. edaphicum LEGE 07299]|uniref:CopG family transcriptional regulator n=1 Tax=Nostoc cf. edaphicum LEGE 07299 TaxID=2777974 RepID=A0ABR9TT72_9NOSO|nr:CopG family transcriptional regulator [Nostoc edaphicum]MBE9103596.1 CopG family transcriptional regulator [Nostoc cf. edaphicum LEGE 07299]